MAQDCCSVDNSADPSSMGSRAPDDEEGDLTPSCTIIHSILRLSSLWTRVPVAPSVGRNITVASLFLAGTSMDLLERLQ